MAGNGDCWKRCALAVGVEDGPDRSFSSRKYYLELVPEAGAGNVVRIYVDVDTFQYYMDHPESPATSRVKFREGGGVSRLECFVALYHNRKA